MALVIKKIKKRDYYYSFLSYYLINKSKSFSKYMGSKKPSKTELKKLENAFKDDLILKISSKNYSSNLLSKDEVIKTLLFRNLFYKKYERMTDLAKRKYDIDSTVSFTLTTLVTEEVNVDIEDVRNAFEKKTGFNLREQISKNMLQAVESIRKPRILTQDYLLELHNTIMKNFEAKTPGKFRERQVYLKKKFGSQLGGAELKYRPPTHSKVKLLLDNFLKWYNSSDLNPIEKASSAHYKLYKIHPFLDGNKRVCRLIFNKTLLDNNFPLINISIDKESYFDALISSVEKDKSALFAQFCLSQYYKQVKAFLARSKTLP